MRHEVMLGRQMEAGDPDHAALCAAEHDGVALCTIVSIEGSFSRRCGAQIAVLPDGAVVGDLADTCLERELAAAALRQGEPLVMRFGKGSPMIDFRLPCGGGLDILIDPSPDRAAIRRASAALAQRQPASLPLAANALMPARHYLPALHIAAYGEGRELDWLVRLGEAAGVSVQAMDTRQLALGRAPDHPPPDRWTAVLLLFHDHEWETALLEHALCGDAFYVGAQGGENARSARIARLRAIGVPADRVARVKSPVGTTAGSRTPQALALTALTDIVAAYETLHPHG